ncbi:MAG: hypothetical protein HYX67_03075 [Candidatus Melainabacteria bacterium]|nr:hypothetical protein [Candidatus Melainabacteria bacterium]
MSGKLAGLAQEFVVQSEDPEDKQFMSVGQDLLDTARNCSEQEVTNAMGILSSAFQADNFLQAVMAAQICGALVERGASPEAMQEQLLSIVRVALSTARESAAHIISQIDPESDVYEAFAEIAVKEIEAESADAFAWAVIEEFYLPCIAVLSYSPESRKVASDLLEDALEISEFSEGARWIARILQVLDNEPYIAIEPDTAIGITGKMSGISGNFQLNELLMAVFPQNGMFPKRRISKTVEDTARGKGPQQPGEGVTGHWNLYTWNALDKDCKLPSAMDGNDWIWNEGIPADIPTFEGYRIVLLGKSAYSRSWSSCRDFLSLKADLTVDRRLTPKEVDVWLKKLAANDLSN